MVAHHTISFYILDQWLISKYLDLMAKNQIRTFLKKIYIKLKKKRAFERGLHFRGKKLQGSCALRFALKRAFNNADMRG